MTDPGELAILAALAGAWWIPTFLCLHDLQNREGVRRVLVWKWAAILCVPVLGAALYWWRGRPELDADAAARPPAAPRRPVRAPSVAEGDCPQPWTRRWRSLY